MPCRDLELHRLKQPATEIIPKRSVITFKHKVNSAWRLFNNHQFCCQFEIAGYSNILTALSLMHRERALIILIISQILTEYSLLLSLGNLGLKRLISAALRSL